MGARRAIGFYVDRIHWHRVRTGAEHSRFVHVIPETVHVVTTLKSVVGKEVTPEFLSV